MLSQESIFIIEAFWSNDLGCELGAFRSNELSLAAYDGTKIFLFARGGAVVAMPKHVEPESMIGPAFVGYADAGTFAGIADTEARLLTPADLDAIERMHALASYEVWGGGIAHISIITHPAHRRRGAAEVAVSAITRIALSRGLLPQYRTLMSNAPSMAIARRLGFERYATTLAVRVVI